MSKWGFDVMNPNKTIICGKGNGKGCGKEFVTNSRTRIYCDVCAAKNKLETRNRSNKKQTALKKKKRENAKANS